METKIQHKLTNTNKTNNAKKKNSNSKKSQSIQKQTNSQNVQSENLTNGTTQSVTEHTEDTNHPKFLVRHKWWIDALLFIIGTIALGGLATLLGGAMFNFKDYQMPPATVPKIVFPIAWAIIYIAIGVSTFLMWRDKEIKTADRKINLMWYFIHMFFNVLWPLWFFRLDLPIVACVWLLLTVVSACIVMYRYFKANLPAGIIFIIYAVWLLYAMYLNLAIVLINF